MNDLDDYTSYLAQEDEFTRVFRAERLEKLVAIIGDSQGWMIPGGPISGIAYMEARSAYINGLDLACIALGQMCVEHMLAGILSIIGRDDHWRKNYAWLLKEARAISIISESEYETLDLLRLERNPYVHARSLEDQTNLSHRAMNLDTAPEHLIIEDAQRVLEAIVNLLGRYPFGL